MLLKITIATTTTCFTGVGLHKFSWVNNNKHPYDAEMAQNRSALSSVLAPDASIRNITVFSCFLKSIQLQKV